MIAAARDSLDGASTLADLGTTVNPNDFGVGTLASPTLVPVDTPNSVTFDRSAAQVLNVVYLTKAAATAGGFFPSGVNGILNASRGN